MPATEPAAESRIANGIVHGLQIALTILEALPAQVFARRRLDARCLGQSEDVPRVDSDRVARGF
jgi:hypothetical protein